MPSAIATASETTSVQIGTTGWTRARRNRALLGAWTIAALALAGAVGVGSLATSVEPDLARLLRYMALLKAVFAIVALGACYWRLARPTSAWREAVYVGSPGMMAGGALCLWLLQSAGLATIGLHVGMFALLAAALTDPDFIPGLRRGSA